MPVPVSAMIFSGISDTCQLMPVMPTPLLPTAPMMPETCVPCPNRSCTSLVSAMKFQPVTSSMNPLPSSSMPLSGSSRGFLQTLLARSGCERSIPESSTATITLRTPMPTLQAVAAWMMGGAHCSAKPGSLGMVSGSTVAAGETPAATVAVPNGASMMKSGSIASTPGVWAAQSRTSWEAASGAESEKKPSPSEVVVQVGKGSNSGGRATLP